MCNKGLRGFAQGAARMGVQGGNGFRECLCKPEVQLGIRPEMLSRESIWLLSRTSDCSCPTVGFIR